MRNTARKNIQLKVDSDIAMIDREKQKPVGEVSDARSKTLGAKQLKLFLGTGLSSEKQYKPLLDLIGKAMENGILSFDTAPSYGCESVLGQVLHVLLEGHTCNRADIWVQDKVDAWQMQETCGSVERFVKDSLKKTKLDYFDCCLIHWPLPEYRDETLRRLFSLRDEGLVRNVGICNVRMRQLMELEQNGLLPDIVQIERNPLRVCNEEAAFCIEKNIELQSYSPLCKFHDDIRDSIILKEIASRHRKSIGQIVMRWHIDTGFSPIFTSKKTTRIEEYADILGFSLDSEEVQQINSMNKNYKMYLESFACPGF